MLKIKIINRSYNPLPKYQTEGSSGLDLHANLDKSITLNKNDIVLVPTGLFIEIPEGYEAQIRSRSSLALKNGIFCLVFAKVEKIDFEEVDSISETQRGEGGFGSTNK